MRTLGVRAGPLRALLSLSRIVGEQLSSSHESLEAGYTYVAPRGDMYSVVSCPYKRVDAVNDIAAEKPSRQRQDRDVSR